MKRITMKELEEHSDDWILYHIVTDRISKLSNPYTPLYERLSKIQKRLEKSLHEEPRNI